MRVYRETQTLLEKINKLTYEYCLKYDKYPTHLELTKEESVQFMEELFDKYNDIWNLDEDYWIKVADPETLRYNDMRVVVKG